MKKIIIGVVILLVVALVGVLAVPIVSVSTWRTDTALRLTDMYSATQENADATDAFLEKTEPSKADIAEEIESVQSTKSKIEATARDIDTLGSNTVDVTGQYADAEYLRNSMIATLVSLQESYEQQVDVLNRQQQNGTSVELADEYAKILEKISTEYTELEQLVNQL